MARPSRRERKELKKQQEREMKAREKHPVFDAAMRMSRRRTNAKLLGMAVAVLIIMAFGGVVVFGIIHDINTAKTTVHEGLYFYVESARFVNSSNSWSFVTSVKNTGSVFISTITITDPSTGSTVGTLSSIPVGQTANGTFAISGVTNDTLYTLEYYAVSGNLTYESTYPVVA